MTVELIRKLRLKKGCQYILFIDPATVGYCIKDISIAINEMGFGDSLIVSTNEPKKIRIIEKGTFARS